MCTTRVRRGAGCVALVDHGGLRRYAQADVPCPVQDLKTLVPDIFCRVDVGVGFVPATQALEDRLADPGNRVSVVTLGEPLAGVLGLPSFPLIRFSGIGSRHPVGRRSAAVFYGFGSLVSSDEIVVGKRFL